MKGGKDIKSSGFLTSGNKKTSQGYVEIKKLSIEQLDDLISRQQKLLLNKSFLEKLPDKGEKITLFKTELEEERKKKLEMYDEACQLMSHLSLNDKNAEEIEWNQGKLNIRTKQLDSDDDDDDVDNNDAKDKDKEKDDVNPLQLLATHSGTAHGKSIKVNFSGSKTFSEDLKQTNKLLYVDKFCEKYGKVNVCKDRFKPNQLKNNDTSVFVTSAEKIKNKLGNKWEVTQATPPVPVYKNVVMISLSESLTLMKEQAEKLKEIEQKHATEKLLQNMSLKMGDKLPKDNITEYRNTENFFEETEENCSNELDDSDCENDAHL